MDNKKQLEWLCDMANGNFQDLGTFSGICHLGESSIAVNTLKNRINIKLDLTPLNIGLENDVFVDINGKFDRVDTSNRGLARLMSRER